MSCIHNLFLLFDTFDVKPNFFFKGKTNYSTLFGRILTGIVYIITFCCAIYFSIEIWEKKKPTVGTSSVSHPHPEKIFYPNEFFFMLSLQNDYISKIDESIYYPIGLIHSTIINSTGTFHIKINLKMEKCSKVIDENFIYYSLLKDIDLENYYCISKNQNEVDLNKLYINEFWGNNNFQMLQVKIYECGIFNDPKICKTKNEINEFLKSPILSYYSINKFIDTTNHSNPFVYTISEKFYYVSNEYFISATEYLRHVHVETDNGLFLSNKKTNKGFSIDEFVNYPDYHIPNDKKFFTMSIQISNTLEIYHRTYYKLQDLGADISAVYGLLMIICLGITHYYSESEYFNELMNSFFSIRENYFNNSSFLKDFDNKVDVNINSNKSLMNLVSGNSSYYNKSVIKINNSKKQIKTALQNNDVRKIINFNLKKIFLYNFFDKLICLHCHEKYCKTNKDKKYKLYKSGKQYISKLLEIDTFLKTMGLLRTYYYTEINPDKRKLLEKKSQPVLSAEFNR